MVCEHNLTVGLALPSAGVLLLWANLQTLTVGCQPHTPWGCGLVVPFVSWTPTDFKFLRMQSRHIIQDPPGWWVWSSQPNRSIFDMQWSGMQATWPSHSSFLLVIVVVIVSLSPPPITCHHWGDASFIPSSVEMHQRWKALSGSTRCHTNVLHLAPLTFDQIDYTLCHASGRCVHCVVFFNHSTYRLFFCIACFLYILWRRQ